MRVYLHTIVDGIKSSMALLKLLYLIKVFPICPRVQSLVFTSFRCSLHFRIRWYFLPRLVDIANRVRFPSGRGSFAVSTLFLFSEVCWWWEERAIDGIAEEINDFLTYRRCIIFSLLYILLFWVAHLQLRHLSDEGSIGLCKNASVLVLETKWSNEMRVTEMEPIWWIGLSIKLGWLS